MRLNICYLSGKFRNKFQFLLFIGFIISIIFLLKHVQFYIMKLRFNYWRYQRSYYLTKIQDLPEFEEFVRENPALSYFQAIGNSSIKCNEVLTVDESESDRSYLCVEKNFNLVKKNCLVYSFKVDYTWTFEDNIASEYGCIVRTFIPSMATNYVIQRPSNVLVYSIGLGKFDEVSLEGWKFKRLSSLIRGFEEEYRIIDVLFIDIDFGEWDAFESMFDDQVLFFVKQLIFQSHTEDILDRPTSKKSFLRFLKIWKTLYNIGFRQWRFDNLSTTYYKAIQYSSTQPCCAVHNLINIHYS